MRNHWRVRSRVHFKRLSTRSKRDRGAALVEAALVLPILLMLTFGIWTTARAWNVNNTLQHTAREAARYGATIDPWDGSTSPGTIRAVADADLTSSSVDPIDVLTVCIENLTDLAASCDTTHTNTTGTDQIFVKLRYPNYKLQFLFFSVNIDMEATAIARFEAP